jgi:hypothetical protein
VYLQSVEQVADVGSVPVGNTGIRGFTRINRGGQGTTELDGTFTVGGLAPGDYYVTASAPGFIPYRVALQTAVNNGSDPKQLLAGLPVAHVSADSSSNVVVMLQHGGALAGRVTWEDGSPAAGVILSAESAKHANAQLPAPLSGLQLNGSGLGTVTDDRGDFRIAGLASDDYVLRATIQSGGRRGFVGGRGAPFPATVQVYAPGVFRRSTAKAYSVRAGDERNDVQMVLDLRGLHTVSGHIGSSETGQTVASGRVSVSDPNEPTLQLLGAIDADGDFTVRYVPTGSYTLQVFGASTQASGGFRGRGGDSTTPAVTFHPFSQPIVVTDTDLTGFAATLTPETAH